MRSFLAIILLVFAAIYSGSPVLSEPMIDVPVDLHSQVGRMVTIRGQFEPGGVPGPYIRDRGEDIYLVPHESV
jgi:hypothetical protein